MNTSFDAKVLIVLIKELKGVSTELYRAKPMKKFAFFFNKFHLRKHIGLQQFINAGVPK